MQSSSLVITVLLASLVGSWIFFVFHLARNRQRVISAVKKFEDIRKQLRDEASGIGLVMELLAHIHENVFLDTDKEDKTVLAQMIVDSACKLMKCSNGTLMLVDPETREMVVTAGKGYSSNAFATRFKWGEGVAGLAAESGKTILVDNIDTDARFVKKEGVDYRFKSMISVPLKVKSRVLGVLNIGAEDAHHVFEERHVRLLNVLADQSALTLENLDLYENLQAFYMDMMESLARSLELKENLSRDTLFYDRLRACAREVAKTLSLPESIARHIEFAAVINGVGKIAIDDAILRKPGKLTDQEYEQIKKHPEIGRRIISKIRFLSHVTPIVLYHQERWDGKGYPAGLKGEEIPLGSRIVSVLNAFYAMVTDRPYRKALTEDQAIEELKRGAGSQFDPKVVQAFIQAQEKLRKN